MKAGAGAGLLFVSPLGVHLRYALRLHFAASNNVAEYEALVNGLRIAIELGVRRLDIRGDSQLFIDQVMKESNCNDPRMAAYCQEVRRLEERFDGLELKHVARRYNEAADELAKLAAGRAEIPPNIFVKDIYKLSVKYEETGAPTQEGGDAGAEGRDPPTSDPRAEALVTTEGQKKDAPETDWRASYLEYLVRDELPEDQTEARRLARRVKSFALVGPEKELYRRSSTGVLQRCIPTNEGRDLLRKIHAGACGHHAAPRTLVGNAFRQGFYWPTAGADAIKIARSCKGCQYYAR
jgi:ribonuclease HI